MSRHAATQSARSDWQTPTARTAEHPIISQARLDALDRDGWVLAASLWMADGLHCLLHRGGQEMLAIVAPDAGGVA